MLHFLIKFGYESFMDCRRAKHSSKLSLLLLSDAVAVDSCMSQQAAASLGLARTLFMEERAAYGPIIELSLGTATPPTFQVTPSIESFAIVHEAQNRSMLANFVQ